MKTAVLILLLATLSTVAYSQKARIVENSRLARLMARINGEKSFAITFGKTIFVSCKKEDFFAKKWWVKHELEHVAQYEKHGIIRFLSLYLYHTAFRPKSVNPFEIEAEVAERSEE